MKTTLRQTPVAILPETSPDALGFFEAVALAGLEKRFVRIPAAVQRRHFGNVPFGRLAVRVENGTCETIKCMDFGRDFDTQSAFWSQADKAWRSTCDARLLENFPRA